VQLRLVDQPRDELLGAEIQRRLRSPNTRRFWAASAWVREPALRRLEPDLRPFRARVGRPQCRGLFGVDLGGTTREGLELAAELFGQARVFHFSGSPVRTFHPKLYLFEQADSAVVIVGSSNLTTGGLWGNFELSIIVELDLALDTDLAFLEDVRNWYERWWSEPNGSRAVNARTIAALEADPSIRLPREGEIRRVFGGRGPSRGTRSAERAFPEPVRGLRRMPRPPAGVDRRAEQDEQETVVMPGLPLEEIKAPRRVNDLRVLLAGIPRDRWKQVGFNRDVTEDFFRVYRNGDPVSVQGVTQGGEVLALHESRLILPETSNQNHRIEFPEPDRRADPRPGYAILVVLERSFRTVRYMSLRPGDAAYTAIRNELAARPACGASRKPETKRAVITYGELKRVWPGRCPLHPR
jgi:hypothetical protein